jgi:hypothetical protein
MFNPGESENHDKGRGVLTKVTKYRTEGRKRATAHTYRKKIRGALLSLARSVILCNTPEHVDAAAALAQAISGEGMNNRNYLLFLTLLETNHPYVIDILIGPRNPFLLFSPIKPSWFLVKETFRILAKFKGNELAVKALLALLGIVQNAYKTSKDGYKIYPLRMSDVYNIGKHLDTDRDQLDPRNRLLLEILFDLYFVGIDSDDRATKQIGIKANDIRMAFFDNTKRLLDAIPDVLLVKDIVRAPVQQKWYRWKAPDIDAPALEAREEPEIKVSLQKKRAEQAGGRPARKPVQRSRRKSPGAAAKASLKRAAPARPKKG